MATTETTETTETLRAAIEAAMRRRYANARGVSVIDGATSISTQRAGAVIDEPGIIREVCVLTHISADALGALAVLVGLRVDGGDPVADVERLTAELDRAHHALREYGPRCAHPDCDALAPLRCDDCGARFCGAHDDDGGEGHNEIAGRTHAVGPDDLRAGAALRAAGGGR